MRTEPVFPAHFRRMLDTKSESIRRNQSSQETGKLEQARNQLVSCMIRQHDESVGKIRSQTERKQTVLQEFKVRQSRLIVVWEVELAGLQEPNCRIISLCPVESSPCDAQHILSAKDMRGDFQPDRYSRPCRERGCLESA